MRNLFPEFILRNAPLCFILAFLFISSIGYSQDGVGINTTTIDPHAILDITNPSNTSKGVKFPLSLHDDITNLQDPSTGIMIFDRDANQFYNSVKYYDYAGNQIEEFEPMGWGMRGSMFLDSSKHFLGTQGNNSFILSANGLSNGGGNLVISPGGKVGVNMDVFPLIDRPRAALDINGSIILGSDYNVEVPGALQYDSNDDIMMYFSPQGGWMSLGGGSDNDWTVGSGSIYNTTDNIGIGTSNPGTNLEIETNNDAFANFQTTDNTWLYTQWLNASGTRRAWMGLDGDLSDFRISIENGTDYLVLDAPNVKIGSANTNNYKLEIITPSSETSTYGIYNTLSSTPISSSYATGSVYHNNSSITNGAKYGIRNNVSSSGTGARYGIYQTVYGNNSSSSIIYGLYCYIGSGGPGTHYGLRLHDASSSGTQYGIYSTGEDFNYFEGDVGIGVTSPSVALDVDGVIELSNVNPSDPGSDVVRLGDGGKSLEIQTNYGYVQVGPQNTSWSHFYTDRARYYFDKEIRVDEGYIGSYNDDLSLRTSGTTRMTISNSDGHVGIATTSPLSDLHIKQSGGSGSAQSTGGLNLESTNSNLHWRIYNSNNYVRFNYSSNAGSSYTAKAYVLPSDGSWNLQSDASLKKDVQPIGEVLSKVKQLRALEYHYLDNPKDAPLSMGFFAQDVQPLFPNTVSKENENSKLGIDYGKFAVISIKAIQEQQDMIEELQKKIDELEDKIKQLDR